MDARRGAAGRAGPPPRPPPPGPPSSTSPSPASVSTDRWWWGSECTSSRHAPAGRGQGRRSPAASRPSLTLTTHSSTAPTLAQRLPCRRRWTSAWPCPQYDFFVARARAGRLPWAPVEAHRPAGRGARLRTPSGCPTTSSSTAAATAARPAAAPASTPSPPSARRRPGHARGSAWARSPSAPRSARPPSRPSSWPPSTSLSGGRLTVGIGAGWYEDEFAAAGVPFRRPASGWPTWRRSIQVLRGMFGGGPFTFDGRYERAAAARCLPRPGPAARPADLGRRQGRPPARPGRPAWPTGGTRPGSGPPTPTAERLDVLARGLRAGRPRPGDGRPVWACTPWWARTRPTWPGASSGCGRRRPGRPRRVDARRVAPGPAGRHGRPGAGAGGGVGGARRVHRSWSARGPFPSPSPTPTTWRCWPRPVGCEPMAEHRARRS